MEQDCLFCKIAAGEGPAAIVYEDDFVVAFDDINPQAPVHTLVVPKEHIENLLDERASAELLGNVMMSINKVAQIKGVDKTGYRVIQNNGPDACQSIYHIHFHILGGKKLPENMA